MQAEQLLIQEISSRPSTEDLIFFIAQDDAMTSACAELHKKIANNKKEELKEINLYCQRYHISLTYLARELDHIQNIFAPRKVFSGDHEILGLQAGASLAQVKQAFRKLSLQYHPDTSNKNNTEEFIRITKAYQRIINNTDKKESPSSSTTAWRYRKENSPCQGQKRKKIYLYLFSFISTVLLLVIVGISIHYQKRAMLNNISKRNSATTATVATQEKSLQPLPLLEQTQEIGQEVEAQTFDLAVAGVTNITNNTVNDHPAPVTSVLPEKTTLAQSSTSQRTVALNVKNHTPPSSLAPHQSQTKAAMNKKYSDRIIEKSIAGKKEDEKKKISSSHSKNFSEKNKRACCIK
ncbi:DnaJ domain-containing protein [Desulfobulbus sp. TB]|nr:DnaJ domain-containing protein [Desulfobulbus sp. TB]